MRKIGYIGLIALFVVSLGTAGTALALSQGGKTTGGARVGTVAGFDSKVNVNAQGTPTTAKGQLKRTVTDPATGALVRQFTVEVTCYFQDASDPTLSRFGGRVTDETGPGALPLMPFAVFAVRDNGEGSKAPPDEFSAGRFATEQDCETAPLDPMQPVESGNLQVHKLK